MDKLRVVVIDDEENAVEIISTILNKYCADVEIVGTANNAENGILIIKDLKPDLAFIDINMSDASGFDVANGIAGESTLIVFVTAYEQYALKAFKFNVFDYVLKPANIEDIQNIIARVRKKLNKKNEEIQQIAIKNPCKIVLNTLNEIIIINPCEIVYIKADGRYSNVFLVNDKQQFVTKSLSEIEALLDPDKFFRTHYAFVVNVDFVDSVIAKDGHTVCLDGKFKVPLSRRRKDEFIELLKKI
jgi:two-component system, LytTR family, response regulator